MLRISHAFHDDLRNHYYAQTSPVAPLSVARGTEVPRNLPKM